MSRTIFIGDVHGCLAELQALLEKVDPRVGDRVIFVGDLVDKGPKSLSTLRYVRLLLTQLPGSVVVSGNHEEKASRFAKKGKWVEPWAEEANEGDWSFIDSMPLTWYDPELNIRVVHGGIFPALLRKHPDAFEKIEARGEKWRKGGGKVMNRARRMLRVRYVSAVEGDMLALNEEKPGDPFWADAYDGSQGMVVYGHSPWLAHPDDDASPQIHGGFPGRAVAVGIDTGCVFGGHLTAYVVEEDYRDKFVSVEAHKQYAKPLFEDD
jgi:diadenosine tetraphosphatase ApaH/serine/threonine PP2A family protein phosphatase